jgi:hypothetical protein
VIKRKRNDGKVRKENERGSFKQNERRKIKGRKVKLPVTLTEHNAKQAYGGMEV